MLENFIFENHLGKRFEGLENRVFLNENDLRDYSWSYNTLNGKITRFFRSVESKKIPLIVYCESDAKALEIKNQLHEMAEADIVAEIPGKIYIGDYYTKGYITASEKSDYLITKRLCQLTLTFTTDDASWYKEERHAFPANMKSDIGIGSGSEYPFDYPYDYTLATNGKKIVCDSVKSNAFKLRIFGYAKNPSITVGGHHYTINGTVGVGESLLIDSVNKTIVLTTATGAQFNWFDKRNRASYIFEPIPSGQNTVTWNGSFGFDLTVIEKRSEPKWT